MTVDEKPVDVMAIGRECLKEIESWPDWQKAAMGMPVESARHQPAALGGDVDEAALLHQMVYDQKKAEGRLHEMEDDAHYSNCLRDMKVALETVRSYLRSTPSPASAPVVKALVEALEFALIRLNGNLDDYWNGDRSEHRIKAIEYAQQDSKAVLADARKFLSPFLTPNAQTLTASVEHTQKTLENGHVQQPAPGLSAEQLKAASTVMMHAFYEETDWSEINHLKGYEREHAELRLVERGMGAAVAELERHYTLSKKQTGGEGEYVRTNISATR